MEINLKVTVAKQRQLAGLCSARSQLLFRTTRVDGIGILESRNSKYRVTTIFHWPCLYLLYGPETWGPGYEKGRHWVNSGVPRDVTTANASRGLTTSRTPQSVRTMVSVICHFLFGHICQLSPEVPGRHMPYNSTVGQKNCTFPFAWS